ncbi:hypothetical protein AADZ86_01770 [Colwelliaceae bacterium BS250]
MNDKTQNNWSQNTKKNTIKLAAWTAAWTVSTAVAAFAPKYIWDFNTLLTIIGVLVNIAFGVGMIIANKNHLQGLDEMMKKIQLDAMAFALGIGLVLGISYELLEDIKLITFEPEISHLLMIIAVTYMAGIIIGQRRYK